MAEEKKGTSMVVTLPSRGFLYEGKFPGGQVEVNTMTTMEIKVLMSNVGSVSSKMDYVLNRCVKFPEGFKAENLLVSDRFYLLVIVRSLSYGSGYGYQVKCPECSARFNKEIDFLTSLDVKLWPETGVSEPFHVTLPHSGDVIGFRLLRGKDEAAISQYSDQRLQKVDDIGDPAYVYRMSKQIVDINGKGSLPTMEVQSYVEKLVARDAMALHDAVEDADCGVKFEIKHDCRNCGAAFTGLLPMSAEFFRPRKRVS